MTRHCPYCGQRIRDDEVTCDKRECIERYESRPEYTPLPGQSGYPETDEWEK